jgi:bifunctional non-homologous end joining protein LigD
MPPSSRGPRSKTVAKRSTLRPPLSRPAKTAGRTAKPRPPRKSIEQQLKTYFRKRDFSITPEPAAAEMSASELPRFVVQMHDATRLHYDFRLEADGVLKSWAVPKGPSLDPADKRLAVRTEDHPLSYIDFEGVIPPDEYGGGPVIVWDRGSYLNIKTDKKGKPISMSDSIKIGTVEILLQGEKLRGGFALIRTRPGPGGKEHWLLIKMKDEHANQARDILDEKPKSVKTGRTIQQVLKAEGQPRQIVQKLARASRPGGAAVPKWIDPMLATLVDKPPRNKDYFYEPKLDGFRALAFRDGDTIRLLSRNKKDLGGRFPEIVEALKRQPVKQLVIDGEIVALDEKGRSSFSMLQQRLKPVTLAAAKRSGVPLYFYVFDLLHANGFDTRTLPQRERSRLLEKAVRIGDPIRRTEILEGDGARLLAAACRKGWEGLIGKEADCPYTSGRTKRWLKLKCSLEQEFVIGGWTDPEGSRSSFGSLLVGYYARGKLIYAGKVGTGYTDKVLKDTLTRLKPLERKTSAFEKDPDIPRRGVHFVEPKLVGQVAFTEWTHDHHIRHPRFKGLREDKDPTEVRREHPARSRK